MQQNLKTQVRKLRGGLNIFDLSLCPFRIEGVGLLLVLRQTFCIAAVRKTADPVNALH